MNSLPDFLIQEQVRQALAEDIGHADISASLLPESQIQARLIARENAILCGRQWFEQAFKILDADIQIHWFAQDGDALVADQCVCELVGNSKPVLSAERTAINFLQTLSGTATTTNYYAQALDNSRIRLLDTRKTIPGLRDAQKYAVQCGGGYNHRHGLYDGVLLKENHIIAAGGIRAAIQHAKNTIAHGLKIEMEVETLDEVQQAIAAGADILLLDNMSIAQLQQAIDLKQQLQSSVLLEVSGNITLQSLSQLKLLEIDFISIGAITKHIKAIDFSLRFVDNK